MDGKTDQNARDSSTNDTHDWRMAGYDATHVGVNLDTTGPRVTLATAWHANIGNVSGAPVVANETVYVATKSGTAYALDRDGSVIWETTLSTGDLSGPPTVRGSPAVVNGTVYLTADGSDGASVFALNAANGMQQWTTFDSPGQRPRPTHRT